MPEGVAASDADLAALREALNQVSVATGHAAIAATAIHNALPHRPR